MFLGTAACVAEASPLDDARQALHDGQVQVAIFKLTRNDKKWANASEQAAADLLLGEALITAGRYEEGVTRLTRLAGGNPAAKFWLAEAYAALENWKKYCRSIWRWRECRILPRAPRLARHAFSSNPGDRGMPSAVLATRAKSGAHR